jgi:hypothetical protein
MCQKCELKPAKDTMVLDAKNMDDIMHNIAATVKMKCSNNGCGRVVGYQDVNTHMIMCPHGPCACTELSCNFAAPPAALVFHLAAAHSIQVHRLTTAMPKEFLVPVPMLDLACSPCERLLVEGKDNAVFILTIGLLGPVPIVSLVCVRSSIAYVWPLYTVEMWARGPATRHRERNNMEVQAEASSNASPGSVAYEVLTLFLVVPLPYLVGTGLSRNM